MFHYFALITKNVYERKKMFLKFLIEVYCLRTSYAIQFLYIRPERRSIVFIGRRWIELKFFFNSIAEIIQQWFRFSTYITSFFDAKKFQQYCRVISKNSGLYKCTHSIVRVHTIWLRNLTGKLFDNFSQSNLLNASKGSTLLRYI